MESGSRHRIRVDWMDVTGTVMQAVVVIWLTVAPVAATECWVLPLKGMAIVPNLDSAGTLCVQLPMDAGDKTHLVTAS